MSGSAADVLRAYFDAWTSKDIERAKELVADDIVSSSRFNFDRAAFQAARAAPAS